ncbi:hypothetical protein QQF64_005631 [Cirrhinus molitorella]|uniref:Uncharacterized protein n=1 Tax=Cirrhinus molitorella TaxID=172907 RepID=A0ABR3MCQ0_9TELE
MRSYSLINRYLQGRRELSDLRELCIGEEETPVGKGDAEDQGGICTPRSSLFTPAVSHAADGKNKKRVKKQRGWRVTHQARKAERERMMKTCQWTLRFRKGRQWGKGEQQRKSTVTPRLLGMWLGERHRGRNLSVRGPAENIIGSARLWGRKRRKKEGPSKTDLALW